MKDYHEEVYNIEDEYWWFKAKRHLVTRIIKNLSDKMHKDKIYLLDCGCGTGAGLNELKKIAFSVGVDKYSEGIGFCRNRDLKDLLNADIEQLPFKDKAFDIITVLDVLEHVDDVKALEQIARVGSDKVIVLIHVPAFMFLWSDHDLAVGHKRRYTMRQLTEKLQAAGFMIKFMRYRLSLFFLLGVLRKYVICMRKHTKKDYKVAAYRPNIGKILNGILYVIVRMEDWFLNIAPVPFGMSILCIAQKSERVSA